jgi:hypothetical protein
VIKRVLLSAGLAWAGVALLTAQSQTTGRPAPSPRVAAAAAQAQAPAARPAPVAAPAAARQVAVAADPALVDRQKAWVKHYCVACHNTRNPLPANDHVYLYSVLLV